MRRVEWINDTPRNLTEKKKGLPRLAVLFEVGYDSQEFSVVSAGNKHTAPGFLSPHAVGPPPTKTQSFWMMKDGC